MAVRARYSEMTMDDEERRALAAWIAEQAGAQSCEILEARQLSGGAIHENWLIQVELQEAGARRRLDFVLRADAPSGVASSRSRAEEFALLEAARGAGVAAPEPYWLASARSEERRVGEGGRGRSVLCAGMSE